MKLQLIRIRRGARRMARIVSGLWRVLTGRAALHLVDPMGGTRIIVDFRRRG